MRKFILASVLSMFSLSLQAEGLVVIGNRKCGINTLALEQVQDIFMARKRTLPNEKTALPIDQAGLRPEFYQKLTGKPIEQIDAYWARIMFSGQASPPMVLSDDKAVIKAVIENEGAIGYVTKPNLTDKIQVLLNLD